MDNDWHATVAPPARQFVLKRIAENISQFMGPVDKNDLIEIARSTEETNFLLALDLYDHIQKSSLKSLLLESGLATSLPEAGDGRGAQAAAQAAETARQILQVRQQWLLQQHTFVGTVQQCMGNVEKLPSRNFNNGQCDYLVGKLKAQVCS